MLRTTALSLVAILASAWPDYSLAQQSKVMPISSPVLGDLGNTTIRFASDEFGAGIQCFGQDGRVFLWFPGQPEIFDGTWSDGTFKLNRGFGHTKRFYPLRGLHRESGLFKFVDPFVVFGA